LHEQLAQHLRSSYLKAIHLLPGEHAVQHGDILGRLEVDGVGPEPRPQTHFEWRIYGSPEAPRGSIFQLPPIFPTMQMRHSPLYV